MSLMDDLAIGYEAKTQVLLDVDGWRIKLIEGGWKYSKQYYITHNHKGYSWPVSTYLNSDEHRIIHVKCSHCHEQVPEETLGFLELLKWETT